jgi:hypothetical protein
MRAREQVFRDDSRHVRLECARCGEFQRYLPRQHDGHEQHDGHVAASRQPLPVVMSPGQSPATVAAPRQSTDDGDLSAALARARDALDWLGDRVHDVRRLLDDAADLDIVAGVTAAAGTAAVMPDPVRIADKAKGRRLATC